MLQILRAYFDIAERDIDRAARMLLIHEAFREVVRMLLEFLGVPDPERPVSRIDPDARQRQLSAVARQLMETEE